MGSVRGRRAFSVCFPVGSIIYVCIVLLALAACGKDSPTKTESPTTTPAPPPPPPVQSVPTRIVITPSLVALTSIGQTRQLTAVVRDQHGQAMSSASVTWSSGNESVATVSAEGLVTAVGNGSTQITARSGNATASITVTVAQSASSITITPESATLMSLGATVQLSATVLDRNGQAVSDAVVSWSSGDESVATVSAEGLVTAVGNGMAAITASAGNASASATVKVMATQQDREALIAFYQGTNGPGWVNSANWGSEEPLATWHGVSTDSQDRVTTLRLVENKLIGEIPVEIVQLENLQFLDLDKNELSGPIPTEIGQLGNLRFLDLGNNELSGTIPVEIGQLQHLGSLSLRNNQLTGSIPPELGQLQNVTHLRLGGNQLVGSIPHEIARMTKLELLEISNNPGLVGPVPEDFAGLVNLEHFFFYETSICFPATQIQAWIAEIPNKHGSLLICPSPQRDALIALYDRTGGPEWNNSTNWNSFALPGEWYGVTTNAEGGITGLDLADNNLSGTLPGELKNLVTLKTLNLSVNPALSGPIPYSYTSLDLEELVIDGTQLCAPPDSEFQEWLDGVSTDAVANCTETRRDFYALTALYHSTNGPDWSDNTNWLSEAPLNTWHGVTTNDQGEVVRLWLHKNNLTGVIPSEIGQLSALTGLRLENNKLSGTLPAEIGQLGNLLVFSIADDQLAGNHLTGTIPPELGQLPLLERLNLRGNGLSGGIPPDLGQLRSLEYLNLELNQLTGTIPSELGRLVSLKTISLFRNQLTGTIPPELAELDELEWLGLGLNRLTGTIPPELGHLESIRVLDLSGNRLTGSIPSELSNLGSLERLFLPGNDLTGSIPPELGRLESLTELLLSENQLTGGIPAELGQLANLTFLSLSRNQLTGSLSPEFGQLGALEELYLYSNRLTGTIPDELGQLGNLTRLDLSDNQLTGTIPAELRQLGSLQKLILSKNQLTGSIPPELGQLGMLAELRLEFNRLSGNLPPSFGDLGSLKSLNLKDNADMSGALPLSLADLTLDALLLEGTRLCAPPDPGFEHWLRSIPVSRVIRCAATDGRSRAYLTQATQSLDFPVPLVSGEDALLRVFIASETNEGAAMPPVRATFYHDGAEVYEVEIPSNDADIPRRIEEGDLSITANARIPGSVLTPGLEMIVEVDPDGELDPSLGIPGRLPPMGRMSVDVRVMPPFELTVVPFLWTENPDRSILAQVDGLSAESDMFRLTRDLLPVGEFVIETREPVWTSVEPVFDNVFSIRSETKAVRTMDGASGHYMGVLTDGGGAAELPGTVIVSGLRPNTIAHELGHNLNLYHAPCGNAGGPDPNFPYPDGSVGTWGYDLQNDSLISPYDAWDLMSYCGPYWISDYSFSRAFGYRLSLAQETPLAAALAPSTRSLLLWGGVNEEGEIVLEPAFVVDAPPSLPDSDGPYRIAGEDRDGRDLFNLRFSMPDGADVEGKAFAFIIPARANWADRLYGITLSGPEGVAMLGGEDEFEEEDGPTAALLLEPGTGRVRGILRDWPEPGVTVSAARRVVPEPELEVRISRGIPEVVDW